MSAKAYLTMEDANKALEKVLYGGFRPYVPLLSEGERFKNLVKEIAEQARLKKMLYARIDRLFEEGVVKDVSDIQPPFSSYNTFSIYWEKR